MIENQEVSCEHEKMKSEELEEREMKVKREILNCEMSSEE